MWISEGEKNKRNILISNEEKGSPWGSSSNEEGAKKVADCADKFQFNCLLNKVILT